MPEFYWNSPTHMDNSTYKRNHVFPKSGDWFFHYSGVDIALNNMNTGGYGRILIRSIFDLQKEIIIKRPMVCAMRLFSGYNAFSESIETQILPYEFKRSIIIKRQRKGLGQNAKENKVDKLIMHVFQQKFKTIKKDALLLNDFLWFLSLMIASGSSKAYLIRENIILYKPQLN